MAIPVKRTNIVIRPNPARVLFRPFAPSSEARFSRILGRAMALSEGEVESLVQQIMGEFHGRHQRLTAFFLHRFEQVKRHMLTDTPVSETRKLLIGAYFTQEYS